MSKIRILTKDDLRASLTIGETVDLMRIAFVELSGGRANVPTRLSIEMPEHEGRVLLMPVYLPAAGQFAVKIVSLFKNNPHRGLPYIQAVVVLVDAQDGRILALMDGEYLTALRTGAASGLATELLARKTASTVMVFGAGAQARLQLEGVCAARRMQQAYVYDPHGSRAEEFVEEMKARVPCNIRIAHSPSLAEEADIICTATTSLEPVFRDTDIQPGTHINAVGAYRPEMCEVPASTIGRAIVVVDSRSSALAEAGDILRAISQGGFSADRIHAEIGEIAARTRSSRTDEQQITLFKSVGNAAQDLVTARKALENAERRNVGVTLQL
jgi:ornithine cyclodeaminase/alanine dehydrogenase-like protein (mu-crystallin family)